MSEESVTVAVFNYRHNAELAQGYLEEAGIESFFRGTDAAGVYAGLDFSNPGALIVATGDAERAREILRDTGFETNLEGQESDPDTDSEA